MLDDGLRHLLGSFAVGCDNLYKMAYNRRKIKKSYKKMVDFGFRLNHLMDSDTV